MGRFASFLQYLAFCRFPALAAAVLVGLPLYGHLSRNEMIQNLFDLGPFGIGWVVFLGLLAARTICTTAGLVLRYGSARFEAPPPFPPRWLDSPWVRAGAPLLLATPLVWVVLTRAWRQDQFAVFLAVFAALALAGGAPPLLHRFWRSFAGREEKRGLEGWLGDLGALLGKGYHDPGSGRLLPGHGKALLLLGLNVALYAAGFFVWRPDRPLLGFELPGLGYLLLLLILFTWLVAGLAFLLDGWRVPVLALVLLVLVGAFALFVSDHYFRMQPARSSELPLPSMDGVYQAWADRGIGRERPYLTVVAASGGGIRAAFWTARVLEGLGADPRFGTEFLRSIRLISSVSGGSVGSLYFLDRMQADDDPAPNALATATEAAGANSLRAMAWGLTYPDLMRPLGGSRLVGDMDRAWALEQAWRRHLWHPERRLSELHAGVAEARLPLTIFNATVVEDGSRFLFSPVTLPPLLQSTGFFGRFPEWDLPAVTAARLSATFPYITPIARPARGQGDERPVPHLADGGYYDNSGLMTAVEWVDWLLGQERELDGLERILILEIDSNPPPPEKARSRFGAWLYQYLGPLQTVMAVRETTQQARNRFELTLLRERWRAVEGGCRIEHVTLELVNGGPLSWKLTESEKQSIRNDWNDPRNQAALEELHRHVQGL